MNIHSGRGDNVSQIKQEDILNAALELFTERGYDATTVPMIAEKATVGVGTIYRYFENKESLVNCLYVNSVHQLFEAIQTNYPFESDIRSQFSHMFNKMYTFSSSNMKVLYFIDSHSCGHYLDDKSKQEFENLWEFIIEFVENGKNQGVLCALPSNAIVAIVYGAFVSIFKQIQEGNIQETPQLVEDLEHSCWNAVSMQKL